MKKEKPKQLELPEDNAVVPTCLICKHLKILGKREIAGLITTAYEYPCTRFPQTAWKSIDDHCSEFRIREEIK